ncbi:GNAT family N-acetyltransferase [Solihabitans fulvus]|uniref:GNAT family N-acetyltransferase n=1 Tax=Solihabitans fulvus TaxID=1892852 RepID=UPI001661AE93|nr:GNAT family N-acetyltransferase [Solihabitans fulvus]
MDTTWQTGSAPLTWRLRIELDDSPGALARITIRLAEQHCNVLALSVLPVPGGVIDELVVRAGEGLLPADLIEAIRAEGGRCVGITRADVRDLVDAPTAALRAAGQAMRAPAEAAEALRTVLAADSVVPHPAEDGEPDDDHQAVLTGRNGLRVLARRGWAPFTQLELARAGALLDLLYAADAPPVAASALLSTDGMALVLRPAGPADEEAVAGLHSRCSMSTLFSRYHSGMRTLPRRWLHRLLCPPRGRTVLAQCGDQVVAMGQLIHTGTAETAEVSLLVEDGWQRRGVGAGLLAQLASTARAAGYRELVAWCLPAENGLVRAAARAGLPTSVRREDGLLRVALPLGAVGSAPDSTAPTHSPASLGRAAAGFTPGG